MGDDTAVCAAFAEIARTARGLNRTLAVPEIVLIGPQGHGKSSLIEAFVGHPFLPVGIADGGVTKRSVHVNLINNPACAEPKITIKRDTSDRLGAQFNSDVEVAAGADSVKAIEERGAQVDHAPIYVNYEYKDVWNMTLIDPIGLISEGTKAAAGVLPDEALEQVMETATVPHRLLVFVEDVQFDQNSEMLKHAKTWDPKLERSIFVVNKFSEQLKNFTSPRDLNKYMNAIGPADSKVFFTSLLNKKDRSGFLETGFKARGKVLARLASQAAGDLETLDGLQFDRRWTESVGVAAVSEYIRDWTWKRYQDVVPELLKTLRLFKRKSEEALQAKGHLMAELESTKLRGRAARYGVEFLQTVDKLLGGSLEGYPALNGQDLAQEKECCSVAGGEWHTHQRAPIEFDSESVPQADVKLYGGQQFERLLAEFKLVAKCLDFDGEKLGSGSHSHFSAEIATAAGAVKVNNAATVTWAASDLVQKQVTRFVKPLAAQLIARAAYILQRLSDICAAMVADAHSGEPLSIAEFPFFTFSVRGHFNKFVQDAAESCLEKCHDEFMSTRLLQWKCKELALNSKELEHQDNAEKMVEKLAKDLFEQTRDRIIDNVTLKVYNFFFVPMQTDLWGDLQGELTTYSDAEIQELFDVENALNRLKDDKLAMEQVVDAFSEQEADFLKHVATFATRG